MKIVWAAVNCNSAKEADIIGTAILKERLAACFDVVPRGISKYFWPPGAETIKTAKGVLLLLTTTRAHYKALENAAAKLHSDKVPFIGEIEIRRIHEPYRRWLLKELVRKGKKSRATIKR